MQPDNPIVGGITLRIPAIRSPGYVAGVSGWTINIDDSAEFNNVTLRGQLLIGVAPNPREVIGGPVPTELVTYYAAGAPATFTPPETVVAILGISYDAAGNYFYQVMVIDSSASPVTSIAQGRFIAAGSTVTEVGRITLNPSGGGSTNLFYEHAKLTLHDGALNDPTFPGLALALHTDINADRLEFQYGGTITAGPGGTNAAQDTLVAQRSAAARIVTDELVWNAGTTATPVTETWHNATLQNGWTNRGAGFPVAGYKRLATDRTVMLVGQILPGTKTDNTVIFNVPGGYRPASKIAFTVGGASGQPAAIVAVDTTGDVTILDAAAVTALQFSNIYPLDR